MSDNLGNIVSGDTLHPLLQLALASQPVPAAAPPQGFFDMTGGGFAPATFTPPQQVPPPPAPLRPNSQAAAQTAGIQGPRGSPSGPATVQPQPDASYNPQIAMLSPAKAAVPPRPKLPPAPPKTLPPPNTAGDTKVASLPGQPGAKPIDSSDWAKPNEQTQAVNKALDTIANMTVPTLEKLQDLPRPPTRETQNSWMSTVLSSAGLFLAMMGSRRSAAPMTAALKSFGGYLEGYNQGQQIVWKQKEQEYQDQLDYAIKQNQLELDQYKANLEANKDKLDMLHESLYATSLLNEDKKIQMELENGHIEIALKMMQARNEALKQVMEQAKNVVWAKMWAGLPITEADIAAMSGAAAPDMLSSGSSEHTTPNNVGNLRAKGGAPGWQTFDTPEAGAAAMINQLRSYGPITLAQAITKYAPPTENNTAAYIQRMSQALKMDPNAPLPVDDPDAMAHIAYVMATVGEGKQVQPDVFSEGTKIAYQTGTVDGKPQEVDGKPQPQATSDTGTRTAGGTDQSARIGGWTQTQITDAATTFMERGELPNLGSGGGDIGEAMNHQLRQAIMQRADQLSSEVARVAQDKDLTPDQKMAWVQQNIPRMAPIVQGLIDGSIDMPSSRMMSTPFWDNVFSLTKAVDPTFSKSLYPQRRATTLAFSGSGQIRVGLNSAANMIKLANLTMDNIEKSGLSQYPALNKLTSFWKTQTGQSTLTTLRQNYIDLAREMVKVIRARGGTEYDIKSQVEIVDPENASPEQLITAVKNMVQTAWYQVEDWQHQYQTDVGKPFDLAQALGPDVVAAHDRVMSTKAEQGTTAPAKSPLPHFRWNPQKQRYE